MPHLKRINDHLRDARAPGETNMSQGVYPIEPLRALPKTDLHLHLDGSLRLPSLIELAKERRVELPSETPEGLLELVFKETYANLPEVE